MTLEEEVRALCFAEGRRPGTAGHRRAVEYLERRLAELGLEPYRGDRFAIPYGDHVNVIAERPGGRMLIGSHFDSVIEAPCADDNAAAVAINLAVAASGRPGIFAFFDCEEPPFFLTGQMGSTRFFEDQMKPEGVACALIMDLVGHAVDSPIGEPDVMFITGAESHRRLPDAILRAQTLPIVATQNRLVGDLSDHHVFRENDVPYLFLTCGRWVHYHEPSDTPEKLDYAKMEAIQRFVENLVDGLGGQWGPRGDGDTTAFELELLHAIGMTDIKTREAIDRFAYAMQSKV